LRGARWHASERRSARSGPRASAGTLGECSISL
jgi:hypothetical protein